MNKWLWPHRGLAFALEEPRKITEKPVRTASTSAEIQTKHIRYMNQEHYHSANPSDSSVFHLKLLHMVSKVLG
jgi:hypothetical protein